MIRTMSSVILLIILITLLFNVMVLAESNIKGRWEGQIEIPGQKLNIILNFSKNESSYRGTIDIPTQGAVGISLDKIKIKNNRLELEVPSLPGNAKFEGEIKGDIIEGKFHQSGYTFPFRVKISSQKPDGQEFTRGDYEIIEKEVSISTKGGNLAGTLALPQGVKKPVKGVVLVAGSGPTDRNGNNPLLEVEVNTLKEIAHYLSSNGIATLRYDKRGIKGSSEVMQEKTSSFDMFKYDLQQVIDNLKKQEQVKEKQVYVIGHSEGATLAIMAAAEDNELGGIGLISGSGRTFAETLKTQIKAIGQQYEKAGKPGVKEELLKALDDVYMAVRNDKSINIEEYNIPKELQSTYLSLVKQPEFVKGWLDTDPVKLLENVSVPVCIIQGSNDGRLMPDDAKRLAAVVPDERLDLNILSGVNHFLKKSQSGDPAPNKKIHSEVLDSLYQFIENN